ncbi:MAG TPA: hypothetical protein VFH87_09455 [Candidatus Udaeobacter sp.]|nr:hypothetical protein [Candidatus Udaeobacter sp.]
MTESQSVSAGFKARAGARPWYDNLLVLLLYVVLTVAMTYPAILYLRAKVMGGPEDNFHFLWELWYVAHALFDLHKSPFFDPDVFVPFGFSLIRNQDLSPGTVLLFSPLTRCFGEVFTYNFLILASFPLTAFGTYLLARELWSNRPAAILAGLIVGFCPYRFAHAVGHLSIVSTQWIPFFFLYLDRLITKPRLRYAVLAGIFFGLSAWATWYYFFMTAIASAFYVAFRLEWKLPRKDMLHLLKLGLISIGVASTFVLPFLIPYYLATHGAVVDYRGPGESQAFAAALADYVIPPTTHFLWGSEVGRLWRNGPNGLWQSEWQLYLGAVALLLAAAGVFHRRRRVVVTLIAMALGCLLLSFGPGLYLTHPPTLNPNTNDVPLSAIPGPGRLLRQLPGFNNLRGWARLGFFVELSVGLLAAAGLDRLLNWLKEQLRAPLWMRAGVAVAAMGLVVIDFFPQPVAMSAVMQRPVDAWLSKQTGDFAFMEYPITRHGYGGPAIYSTRLTGKRIIMGSSQNPPNLVYWSDLSAFPSPTTIDLLAGWGAKYVLVDENLYRAGSSSWNIYQTWNTLESAIKLNPRLKEVTVLDGVHIYQIDSGTGDIGRELLINGSFEQATTARVHGWQLVGKPTIDHTGKYSAGGNAAYNVTGKDFLLSAPIPVDSGQCYRLSARQMANSSKPGTLRLQVDWKDEHKRDLRVPTIVADDVRSGQHWQESSMVVRAPTGSRYAVVHAEAAAGTVWVDDYSFKKIPSDCEPVLFVTPNPVSVPAGQSGRATISWNVCCNPEARLTLTVDDGAEEVFAHGQSGLRFFDGIKPGTRYEFRLYSEQVAPTKTTSLSAIERTATIAADPNPVPSGSGPGHTKISWATLAGADAEIYVTRDGGPEHLFARGAIGSIDVPWIVTGSTYEFRLYSTGGSRRLLAKTIVNR